LPALATLPIARFTAEFIAATLGAVSPAGVKQGRNNSGSQGGGVPMGHEALRRDEVVRGASNRAVGLVFAVVFVIIGTYPLLFGAPLRVWSVAVGAAFAGAALLVPHVLAPLSRVWLRFGLLLHQIVSPIVLGFLFFFVVAPLGFLMRLLGKDPLRLRRDAAATTYWIERNPPGPKPDTLTDQF
jgi:hypothetical protein